ncbi:MAG TPA: PcfJ domain-containing protein [Chthonomonadaceae bacterium]|nr:PcfJ domain-containing protein [Chthonomonadaceae bacterium]
MRQFNARTLKERKELEQQREQRILRALKDRGKVLENVKREKKQKKKSLGELLMLLNLCSIEGHTLRPIDAYVPRSHNLEKQLIGLLNHLFVRYPVPAFLYQACLTASEDPFKCMHEMYRQWFVTLAQGGSFSKFVKGFMTSREAFAFLSAPAGHHIHENVWWAKMRVAGLPVSLTEKLIERVFSHYFFDDPHGRLAEVVLFYARYYQDMDKVTFGEITDFIAWKLRHDRDFRLKGRTISSVIKLTNEWQAQMQKAKLGQSVEWKGLGLPDWELEERDRIWIVGEIRNNRELLNEGRKQRHCVYSYVHWCMTGRSAIFSLRAYRKIAAGCTDDGRIIWDRSLDQTRITIEVNSQRAVVQARGLLNRMPTDEEKRILRHWVGEMGLTLNSR